MALFGSDKFKCARCGQKNEPLGFAPIPTDLGTKDRRGDVQGLLGGMAAKAKTAYKSFWS
jgi:hypothetical protein